jgi:predicted O-methyltransferase YrrM
MSKLGLIQLPIKKTWSLIYRLNTYYYQLESSLLNRYLKEAGVANADAIFIFKSKRELINNYSSQLESFLLQRYLKEAGIANADAISTFTNKRELGALYNLAAACPQGALALEIGSYLGASSCYLAAGLARVNGSLICVDTWQNETMPDGERDTFAEFQKNTNGAKDRIATLRKRSEEISDDEIRSPLNLVFIDGDHSYAGVKNDFECVQKWLAEDGIIAFHDFSHPNFEGVSRVIGEALASGKWMITGQVDTLVWIKRAKWDTPAWLSNV